MTKKGSGFLGRNRRLRKKEEDAEALRLGLPLPHHAERHHLDDDEEQPYPRDDYFDDDVPEEELQPSFGLVLRPKLTAPDPNLALHDKRRGPPDRRQLDMDPASLGNVERRGNINNRRKAKFMTIDEMVQSN